MADPEGAASPTSPTLGEIPPDVRQASLDPASHFGPPGRAGQPRYILMGQLGRGGMGTVMKAYDTTLQRIVALKLLSLHGPDDLARFHREAKMAAQLQHPGIATVFEAGEHERSSYIAMQYVEGATAAEGAGRIPVRRACEIVRDAAEAVACAHARGVLHRDLKPQNIMLDGRGHVYVMDFGLAKSIGGGSTITMRSEVVGTPAYMSPEQAEGDLERVGPRSDVYALGATLYELVTGKPPFVGINPGLVLRNVLERDPIAPRRHNPRLHPDVETIVLKAMDKHPERRYASAEALSRDLARFLEGEPIDARRLPWPARAWRRVRKSRGIAAALAVAAAALAAAFYAGAESFLRARRQERLTTGLYITFAAETLIDDLHRYQMSENASAGDLARFDPQVRDLLDRALAQAPDLPDALALEARWDAMRGRPTYAAAFDRACALGPRNPRVFYLRGRFRTDVYLRDAATRGLPTFTTGGLGVGRTALRLPDDQLRRDAQADFRRMQELVREGAGGDLKPHHTLLGHAMDSLYRQDVAGTRRTLEEALRLAPWDQDIHFFLAILDGLDGDFAAGVRALEELGRAWPRNPEVCFYRASFRTLAISQRRARQEPVEEEVLKSVEDYRRTLELGLRKPAVRSGHASALKSQAELAQERDPAGALTLLDQAIGILDALLDEDPASDYLYLNNRALYRKLRAGMKARLGGEAGPELEAAAADCDEAIRRHPDLPQARMTRADVLAQIAIGGAEPGSMRRAFEAYEDLLARWPELDTVMFNYAQHLGQAAARPGGEDDPVSLTRKAIGLYTSAIRVRPDFGAAHLERGLARVRLGRLLGQAGRGEPELYALALGDLDLAGELLKGSTKMQIVRADAIIDVAREIEASGGDPVPAHRKSIEAAEAAVSAGPEVARAHEVLGHAFWFLAYHKLRHSEDASVELERARMGYAAQLKRAPDDTGAIYNRGMMSYWLKRDAEALADWERLLKLDPGQKAKLEPWMAQLRARMARSDF